jgi:hypothetical protein
MIKIISAITFSAFIAGAISLPGFAAPLEAKPAALQKGDRLLSRVVATDCAKQMWPNFSTDCLHGKGEILAVRRIAERG